MLPRLELARRIALVAVSLTLVLGLAACDGDDDTTDVDVSLKQWSVTPVPSSASSGRVRFVVKNDGTVVHEFLVIRTNLAPNALPTEANGSYEEDGPGTDLLDEIEDISPGETDTLALDLTAGNYVLICNMVGPLGAHYGLGMRTAFTVH